VTYTLDTNAITAMLTNRGRFAERFERMLAAKHKITSNAVSYYELKRGLVLPRFTRQLAEFEEFVEGYGFLPMNLPALDVAVRIYQQLRSAGKPLEDADILMAGIALANNATLVTRNTRHFARIQNLRLEDWEAA
jgi:tRNA(fMet)-specific endonuclease VapC